MSGLCHKSTFHIGGKGTKPKIVKLQLRDG